MFYELCCLNDFIFWGRQVFDGVLLRILGQMAEKQLELEAKSAKKRRSKFLFVQEQVSFLFKDKCRVDIRLVFLKHQENNTLSKDTYVMGPVRGEFYIQTKFLSSANLHLVPCTFKFKR